MSVRTSSEIVDGLGVLLLLEEKNVWKILIQQLNMFLHFQNMCGICAKGANVFLTSVSVKTA